MVDWDGKRRQTILIAPKILISPAWKFDGSVIFYSEFTNNNVRLMATDLRGVSWPVIDHDGTTVGMSSVPDLKEVVYCHSGSIWKYGYNRATKTGHHGVLIKDGGTCASPTLVANGDVIYCASGKIKRWSQATGISTELVSKGYSVGPSYHAPSRRVVYSHKLNGTMQLFLYDMHLQKSRQLTFDKENKLDPSWSPCGVYVVYCGQEGKMSIIKVVNTITGTTYQVSPEGEYCTCPSWSPNAMV